MNLPRPMKADDISSQYFEHNPNAAGSFFAPFEGWMMEPKVDGVRAYLHVEDGETRVYVASSETLVHHDLPQLYGLQDTFSSLLLDGELVIPGEPLGKVAGALSATRRTRILDRAVFYAFDLLGFKFNSTQDRLLGVDLRGEHLGPRREALEHISQVFPTGVHLVPQYEPSHAVADAIRDTGFEGFMLKATNHPYIEKRHPSWRKVKWLQTIDCFVVDYEPGRGGYEGLVGSLVMAVFDGNEILEVGKHGVFSQKLRLEMTDPVDGGLRREWYGKVMELTYQDVGTNARLRHPRLYRLRPDKEPKDCDIQQLTGRNLKGTAIL